MKDLKEDYMYKLQTQFIIHNITLKQNTEHKQALQDKDEKQDILNLKNYIDELEAKNKELQTNLDQYFYHSAPETKFEYYNEVKPKIKFEYYINEVKTADQLDAEVTKATTENVFKFIDEVFDSEEEEKEKTYQEAMSTVLMAMKAENDKMKKLKQQEKQKSLKVEENTNHDYKPPNKNKNEYYKKKKR